MVFNALFGRTTPTPASLADAIGAMGLASHKLEEELDTVSTGRVAVIVRPGESQEPGPAQLQVQEAVSQQVSADLVSYQVRSDTMGLQWVIIKAGTLGELVSGAQAVSNALLERNLDDRIVAVVFPFTWKDQRLYWFYQQRLRRYTPFVPLGDPEEERRDHTLEVRMESALRRMLPTERRVSEWYPIWELFI